MEQSGTENRIARLERKRRQLLSSGVWAFALWQGLILLGDIKSLDAHVKSLVVALSLVPWAVWAVGLVQTLRFGKEMAKEPKVARALGAGRWAMNVGRKTV